MEWNGVFKFEYLSRPNPSGERIVLWRGETRNNLADEGERNILDSYLRNINHPTTFFIRLFNDTPVETDSLASLTGEPGFGNGYAQQQVLRSSNANGWPTIDFVGGNAQAVSKKVTFGCHLAYTVTYAILALSSDNTLSFVSYGALPGGGKTLASGEEISVTYKPTLS